MKDLLNHVAGRTQLFLSPDNQSHATLPSGAATPIYSEDFFTFLNALADDRQIDIPNAVKLGFALRKLDARAHASQRVQHVPLRTFQPDPQTLLIDLHDNFDAVELTRKSWKITSNLDTQFVPFSAQTRISGVDIDNRSIRKGAVDAILKFAGTTMAEAPVVFREAGCAGCEKRTPLSA